MLKKFLTFFQKWKYSNISNFLIYVIGLYFCFISLQNFYDYKTSFQIYKTQLVIKTIRSGSQEQNKSSNLAKNTEKFFKEMLIKHFPDFQARVELEKRQAEIYENAMKKIKTYKQIFPLLNDYEKLLTDQERSSINYFHGIGIYKKYQDPSIPPNLFDTRVTFLKKMENQDMRENFLLIYNRTK